MPGTVVPDVHMYKPWAAGDIVYLKPWSGTTRDGYQEAHVRKEATNHPAVVLFRSDSHSKYVVVAVMTSFGGKLLSENVWANSSAAIKRCYVPIRPSLENEDNPLGPLTITPHPYNKNSYINLANIYCLADDNLGTFRDKAWWDRRQNQPYALVVEDTRRLLDFVETDIEVSTGFKAAKRTAMVRKVLESHPVVPSVRVPTAQNQSLHLPSQSTAASRLNFAVRNPSLADHLAAGAHNPVSSTVSVPARQYRINERTRLLRHSSAPPQPSRPNAKDLLGLLALLGVGAAAVYGRVWFLFKAWLLAGTYLAPGNIWAGLKNVATWLGQSACSAAKGLGSWLWSLVVHERASF